ncbi:MAG TPA: hypothetical protein VEC99_06875, partial [Clostridia bacterium]|nr:hypothetical protein [Clostridia bacterium]
RSPVLSLMSGQADEIYLIADYVLYAYRNSGWESIAGLRCSSSLASNAERLFVGLGPNGSRNPHEPRGLGVRMLNLADGRWRSFPAIAELPSEQVTTLTVDGETVWVGGAGYIAQIDPTQDKVLKFAYVPADRVEQIQIAGGYVWAYLNNYLYRATISNGR